MKEAVIASSVRTAVGKAYKGTLHATRPDDLAAVAITGAIGRIPGLDPKEIEDVVLGCAMPEAEQGMNVARIASLRAGLQWNVPPLPLIASVLPACRPLPWRRNASCSATPKSLSPAARNR